MLHCSSPASNASTCSDDDDENGHDAQHCRTKPPAGADQRRRGGEHGAALVPRHQHVADVALAAGRAHLAEEI